jgi:NADP-dependent 3-hydroxy acid dehydrogenase YdfG
VPQGAFTAKAAPVKPRCVAITGASSGLGAGLARSYAQPGRVLALLGRNPARLEAVAEACRAAGAQVVTGALDLTDGAATQAWLEALDTAHPIDLVVANAGVSAGTRPDGQLEGAAAAVALVRANLLGVLHTIEPLLPRMLARGGGHVAVVASVAGYRGLPDSPAYCASKAGVRLYGESLRAALAPRGIAVSVIVPGFFASPMSRRFLGPKPFLLELDRAVARTRAGLDRRAARIVFPRRLGWLLRAADLIPARLGDAILRVVRFRIVPE